MDTAARVLILSGIAVTVAGLALLAAVRLGLERLPGDVGFDRGNVHVAIPLATSIVLSIVLTLALNVAIRIWR